MSKDPDNLIRALRNLPAPDPRPEFVDRALAKASGVERRGTRRLRQAATRWETWLGAAFGGAIATMLTLFLVQPLSPKRETADFTLALNERREIDVLIESERSLENATIRIAVTGGIVLDGFENDRAIDWQANLDQGKNVLSLPILARDRGPGRLVAVVEHEGRKRTVMIDLIVKGGVSSS